jgi:hypothetical protein
VDIPNAIKGSARGNASSNGKRNFHKRKNEWRGLKKQIGEGVSDMGFEHVGRAGDSIYRKRRCFLSGQEARLDAGTEKRWGE